MIDWTHFKKRKLKNNTYMSEGARRSKDQQEMNKHMDLGRKYEIVVAAK